MRKRTRPATSTLPLRTPGRTRSAPRRPARARPRPAFEILEHPADIGFLARGATRPRLFEHAAAALLAIAAAPARVTPASAHTLRVEGEDLASLLVNFLSEVLYLFDAGRLAVARVHVQRVTPTALSATLVGERRSARRHPWRLIVKAVTYHRLEVKGRSGRWTARVYLDI